MQVSQKTQEIIDRDRAHVCHNYAPPPVVITRGKGIFAWDVDGNKYYDFHSGYSSCNQGHCHPKIIETLTKQAKTLTLTSRGFFNDKMGEAAEYLCKVMGYDKLLPSSSGVEACESAIKLARRWAYSHKHIVNADEATVLVANGCFWGRSITACSGSDDDQRRHKFGPFTPGFDFFEFGDLEGIEVKLKNNPNVCAVMIEPIQGENGVRIPPEGFMKKLSKLCKKHDVLLICDEV